MPTPRRFISGKVVADNMIQIDGVTTHAEADFIL